MPKKKPGPALFELLWDDAGRGPDTAGGSPQLGCTGCSDDEGLIASGPGRTGADPKASGSPAPQAAVDRPVPFCELEGGRLRVSFTSATAAVAVFLALLVILVTFEIGSSAGYNEGLRVGHEAGRASYAAETMDEIEVARAQPPATQLVSSLLGNVPSDVPVAGEADGENLADGRDVEWIRGFTYIVMQEFAADHVDDIADTQRFLADHGIATARVQLSGGAVQLITRQGYNHRDSTQKRIAEELLRKGREVGARYYASGGGYRLEGYFKTLTRDAW